MSEKPIQSSEYDHVFTTKQNCDHCQQEGDIVSIHIKPKLEFVRAGKNRYVGCIQIYKCDQCSL